MDFSIVKVPLRIPIAGGGTDIPDFTKHYEGYCISASIDKYIYVIIKKNILSNKYHLKYSKTEKTGDINLINHPIIRTIFKRYKIKPGLELITFMDVPHSSGLGSSSSFTVALIRCINILYLKNKFNNKKIAEEAILIERIILKESGGIQDQVIASYQGIKQIFCKKNYKFHIKNLSINEKTKLRLEKNLSLFFTNKLRSSSQIQKSISKNFKKEKLDYLLKIKEIGILSKKNLLNNELDEYGRLLNKHWQLKKKLSKSITFPKLDKFYDNALNLGCLGGKMIGAGGGGFIIFYSETKKIQNDLKKLALKNKFFYTPFKFINFEL